MYTTELSKGFTFQTKFLRQTEGTKKNIYIFLSILSPSYPVTLLTPRHKHLPPVMKLR
jgi:hypothetical protein